MGAIIVTATANNVAPLLKRAFMFLEDGDFARADDFCEQVLNLDPENGRAYLGKLMVDLQVRRESDLKNQPQPFDENSNYQKIMRFGNDALKNQVQGDIDFINNRNENARQKIIFENASKALDKASTVWQCGEAISGFESIPGFEGVEQKLAECKAKIEAINEGEYNKAKQFQNEGKWEEAIKAFDRLGDYRDSKQQTQKCREAKAVDEEATQQRMEQARLQAEEKAKEKAAQKRKITIISAAVAVIAIAVVLLYVKVIKPNSIYNSAVSAKKTGNYDEAIAAFESLGEYRDAAAQAQELSHQYGISLAKAGKTYPALAALRKVRDKYEDVDRYLSDLEGVVEENAGKIAADRFITVGLRADGTVVAVGRNKYGQCGTNEWRDIVAVSSGGDYTVGLRVDGTVVAVGYNDDGQCDTDEWRDIVTVASGVDHTVGLRADGTVVAVGSNKYGQCDTDEWRDIVTVAAKYEYTVGLRADGTVVAVGSNSFGECNTGEWQDIVAVAAGDFHTVGLRADGTVVAVGSNNCGQCDTGDWSNIVAVTAGDDHTVGLRANGTVVTVGSNEYGQCDMDEWRDIVAVAAGDDYTVGLKADGTVVAVGNNIEGRCDTGDWSDIVAVAAGTNHTVGLKSDGTVIAVGDNDEGQCDTGDWKLWD